MRQASFALLTILSLSIAAYAILGYLVMPVGALVHPAMAPDFVAHPVGVYAHVFAAAIALLFGPFQLSARLRRARPALHRWMGRVYLGIGVLVGGVSGLYIAQFAFGGPWARLGFAALAICWLGTAGLALRAIRAGDVQAHRRWMVRNFALSFAAVTLRLYIPASFVAGIEFAFAYRIVAWLCWVPNLVIAELLLAFLPGPPAQPVDRRG